MTGSCHSIGDSLEFLVEVGSDGSTEDPDDRNNVFRRVTVVCDDPECGW